MTRIIRYDNACQILDEDNLSLFKELDNHLSYRIQGAEFSKAFRGYINDRGEEITWDGCRHIMTSTGRFPPGLLERTLEFYLERGIYPEIEDRRLPKTKASAIDIFPVLKSIDKLPRPYQIEAVEAALKTDRGIIRAATGSGKTAIAALLTARLGKPTIIYVIGKDLLYQIQDFFQKIFVDAKVGIVGDGKCEIGDINIATIWSIGKVLGLKKTKTLDDEGQIKEKDIDPSKYSQIKQMILDAKVHIMDECHLAACDTVQVIAKNIKAEYVYGMSASPWRDDGADILIEAFLGRKIIDISAKKLIKQGYLVKPDIRFIAPAPYPFKTGKYQKIYSKYIVENEQRNNLILKCTRALVEQKFKPLVLFNSIKHGKILNELLSKEFSVGLLSGEDNSKKRDKVKSDFDTGKIKCILASKIFDIGVDIPALSGLIIGSAGKSSVRALQRIGRVIRPCEGKTLAAVFDFADQAPYLNEHSKIRKEIYEQEFETSWPKREKK